MSCVALLADGVKLAQHNAHNAKGKRRKDLPGRSQPEGLLRPDLDTQLLRQRPTVRNSQTDNGGADACHRREAKPAHVGHLGGVECGRANAVKEGEVAVFGL